jgi:type I restriction enzyme S subunit
MSFPRYPTYKPSGVEWLGEVPEHWSLAPLKKLLDIQNGSDYKAVEAEDGYPVIGSGGPFAFASQYHYDGESVLLGRKGTIDKPLYIRERFWAVDTMYWSKIRDGVHGRFAFYTSQCIPFQYYSTNTALPSMTKSLLGSHIIAVPCETEQGAIATFLDHETAKIDALIAEQQRLIELLQEKRQAVISHAVTKGLNPDAPMKNSGVEWLGEVPEHWEKSRLRALFRQEKRQDQPTSPVLSVYRDYGVILKDSRDDNHNKTPESLSAYQLVNRDDLVVNKMKAWQGSLGVSVLHGITSPDYAVFTPHHNEFSLYLHFLLRSCRMTSVYRSISNGIRPAQWRIEPGVFLDLPVFLPPTHEQELIAGHVSRESEKFDQLVKESESFVNLLQERRSALISAAVTGQIDVRGLVPEVEAA